MASIVWSEILSVLVARGELTEGQICAALEDMMSGCCGEAEAGAFLIGLRMKGETAVEVAAAAQVMRRHMVRWDPGYPVLDTCGTGGDGTGTFNISTAAALVAAGAGLKVVKHGNRSVSSKSGSADVLAALGVNVEGSVDLARRQLENAGFAFCFAPTFHPALRHVAAVRRRLGVPTIFNCLGPLANPAGAARQLLGVSRPELVDVMAQTLIRLGTVHALVVCGMDGLDEVSLAAKTRVREVSGNQVREYEWAPEDFGLEPAPLREVKAAGAADSAALIESVVSGEEGPAKRLVLANAAAALVAGDLACSPREGVALARAAIESGRARKVLDELRAL